MVVWYSISHASMNVSPCFALFVLSAAFASHVAAQNYTYNVDYFGSGNASLVS